MRNIRLIKYKLNVYAQVDAQMDEITAYFVNEAKLPSTAKMLLKAIQQAMHSLKVMADRIPLVREEPWRSKGIRRMMAKNYAIYFWIDEAARLVNIVAVIYGKCDQGARLSEVDFS